eukprot:768000-Hanusia_phi.AAC.1
MRNGQADREGEPPGMRELTRRAPVLSALKLMPMPQRDFLVKERPLAPRPCCWVVVSLSLSLLQSQQNILERAGDECPDVSSLLRLSSPEKEVEAVEGEAAVSVLEEAERQEDRRTRTMGKICGGGSCLSFPAGC